MFGLVPPEDLLTFNEIKSSENAFVIKVIFAVRCVCVYEVERWPHTPLTP